MQDTPYSPFEHPSVWTSDVWRTDQRWIRPLSDDERAELRRATDRCLDEGFDPLVDGAQAFLLPQFGHVLSELLDELEGGRGFVLLRGLPIAGRTMAFVRMLNAGIASHLGHVIRQNHRGDRVAEVADRGQSYAATGVRGHGTNAAIEPHCDSCDVVALLCVRAARHGGESCIASSSAIFNATLEQHPEFLPILTRGFRINLAGKGPTGDPLELSHHRIAVFSVCDGLVSCRFNRKQILDAAQIENAPLSDIERRAIDWVSQLAEQSPFRFDMAFQPGDMQLLNNHCILHSRRAFQDPLQHGEGRLLLRSWINLYQGRTLAPEFADRLNTGPRGEVATMHRGG